MERQFDARSAAKDLERFRRSGPDATTRMLIDALRTGLGHTGSRDLTLLDVGGGVGAIHHQMLDSEVREAVQVDFAPAYLEAARVETVRRAHAARVRFVQGDFVELASSIDVADLVTLDRVICCYPKLDELVRLSAAKAKLLYGAVYPRDVWWVRVVVAAQNLIRRLKGSTFRTFVHPPLAIDALLREAGLRPFVSQRTMVWEVVAYLREPLRGSVTCAG
jgi:magnesium-protoporphyrin O-methyltransferase